MSTSTNTHEIPTMLESTSHYLLAKGWGLDTVAIHLDTDEDGLPTRDAEQDAYNTAVAAFEKEQLAGNTNARLLRATEDESGAQELTLIRTSGEQIRSLILPESGVRMIGLALAAYTESLVEEEEMWPTLEGFTNPEQSQLASHFGQQELISEITQATTAVLDARPVLDGRTVTITTAQLEAFEADLLHLDKARDIGKGADLAVALECALENACKLIGLAESDVQSV